MHLQPEACVCSVVSPDADADYDGPFSSLQTAETTRTPSPTTSSSQVEDAADDDPSAIHVFGVSIEIPRRRGGLRLSADDVREHEAALINSVSLASGVPLEGISVEQKARHLTCILH